MKEKLRQQKFVSGSAATGRLILTREDKSTAVSGAVIVQGASLVVNNDSTVNLVFNGS